MNGWALGKLLLWAFVGVLVVVSCVGTLGGPGVLGLTIVLFAVFMLFLALRMSRRK